MYLNSYIPIDIPLKFVDFSMGHPTNFRGITPAAGSENPAEVAVRGISPIRKDDLFGNISIWVGYDIMEYIHI